MAEQELKDHDSVFRELHSTVVHYKLAQEIDQAHPTALHCYHGFGANTFSWSYVYKSLAKQLHAQVTKHDMPGFGLTQRPSQIDAYSLQFNGHLGRLVMDAELATAGIPTTSDGDHHVGPGVSLEQLQSVSSKHQAGQEESKPAVSRASIDAAAANKSWRDKRSSNQEQQTSQSPALSPRPMSSSYVIDEKQSSDVPFPLDEPPPESPLSSKSSWSSVSSTGSTRQPSSKEADSARDSVASKQQKSHVKRILMGHSLGAACAAAEVVHYSKAGLAHWISCLRIHHGLFTFIDFFYLTLSASLLFSSLHAGKVRLPRSCVILYVYV